MSYSEDSLKHYGVLGMKWGKRKAKYDYPDPNKTYRKSGKDDGKRYKATGNLREDGSPEFVEIRPRRMSNKELAARVKRLELEERYKKLQPQPQSKTDIEKIAKTLGTVAAISVSAWKIYENMDKIAKAAKTAKAVT